MAHRDIKPDHHLRLILWLRALALAGPPCELEVPLDDLAELVRSVRVRVRA